MAEPTIDVKGLKEFRRDIKRLDKAAERAMVQDIKDAGQQTLTESRSLAPRLSGELARSIRLSVTTKGVSVYSSLPQAPVLHWGGTIEPRGARISFPRTEFISKPAERHADQLAEAIGDSVERAARATGWH